MSSGPSSGRGAVGVGWRIAQAVCPFALLAASFVGFVVVNGGVVVGDKDHHKLGVFHPGQVHVLYNCGSGAGGVEEENEEYTVRR